MEIEYPFKNSDKGGVARPVIADDRAQLVRPSLGKYAQSAREGKLFTYNAPSSGLVLPIFSATAQLFGIWNPPGSGVLGVLARLRMTYLNTTGAAGGFCLGILRDVAQLNGTAGPISAATLIQTVERGRLGSTQNGNKIKALSAITVTTALMAVATQLGLNQTVLTATDATNILSKDVVDFDGEVQLEPGNALFLCGNIATLSSWVPSLSWIEDPI